jgi:hypothetical protein
MDKHEKKVVKKEVKALERKEVASKVAAVAASGVKALAAPKKKDSGFLSFLKGAARVAADVVPPLLPFLLAAHKPSNAMAAAAGAVPAMAYGAAPLAVGQPLGNMCGLKAIRSSGVDRRGNVESLVVGTMDYITALPAGTYSAGTVLYESWVSPLDPAFAGTKFAAYGNLNERYRMKKGVFIYEPTQAAIEGGAICMCVFNDPEVDLTSLGGAEVLRACGSQSGSETCQIWTAGACAIPLLNKDMLYTDPDGTDIRLTVAGKLVIIAASDFSLSESPGNLYLCAETEYEIPSLADDVHPGDVLMIYDPNPVDVAGDGGLLVFSSDVESVWTLGGQASFDLTGVFHVSGISYQGPCVKGLPEGTYVICSQCFGSTTLTVPPLSFITDEGSNFGVVSDTPLEGVNATGTQGMQWRVISVPEGAPAGVPMIGWNENTSAATGDYRIFVIMVNDAVNSLTVEPFMEPLPPLFRGVPRQGGKKHQRKRMELFVKTLQGQNLKTAWEIRELAKFVGVHASSLKPAPVVPIIGTASSTAIASSSSGTAGTSSYVSLSSLPSLALAAPATAVAKGPKLGRQP